MAALQGHVAFGQGASVALTGGTAKTPIVVTAPANQRLKILGYGFFFDGTSNSAQPVQIEIQRTAPPARAPRRRPSPARKISPTPSSRPGAQT